MKEEEEEKSAQLPLSKWSKTAPMATATAPTSHAATEGEDATPKDTPCTIHTPSAYIQSVTLAGDIFSVTIFGIPEDLIPQHQNFPEGKRIYLHHWEDCGSDNTNLDGACSHMR